MGNLLQRQIIVNTTPVPETFLDCLPDTPDSRYNVKMEIEMMQALHFNKEDMEYNKRGELSPDQKKRILNSARALTIILGIFSATICSVIFIFSGKHPGPGGIGAMIGSFVVLNGFSAVYTIRSISGVRKNTVLKCTGAVSFYTAGKSGRYLRVEEAGLAFPFHRRTAEALFYPQWLYDIYYLESTMEVLTAEKSPVTGRS